MEKKYDKYANICRVETKWFCKPRPYKSLSCCVYYSLCIDVTDDKKLSQQSKDSDENTVISVFCKNEYK